MLTKEQDYVYEHPALTFRKLRRMELTAGCPPRSNPGGRNGPATVDNPDQWARERVTAIQTETDYRARADHWKAQRPRTDLEGTERSRPT